MKIIEGMRFTRLLVLRPREKGMWEVLCDCGTIKQVHGASLKYDRTKSCGCLQRELTAALNLKKRTHGMTKTAFYKVWTGIKKRCDDKKHKAYKDYGGRGIKYLWGSFEDFRKDMHDSYLLHLKDYGKRNTSIDRIDNDGNYCKENCRWATWKEQSRNRRASIFISHMGQTLSAPEWANKIGISAHTLRRRLREWDIQRSLEAPLTAKKRKS